MAILGCLIPDSKTSELSIGSDEFLDMFGDCYTALSKKLTEEGARRYRRGFVRVVGPGCSDDITEAGFTRRGADMVR